MEQNLSTHINRAILLSAINVPKFDWLNGVPSSNCYYYNKIKEHFIHIPSFFPCLDQHNNAIPLSALLDFVFTNINDVFLHQITPWSLSVTVIPHFILISN